MKYRPSTPRITPLTEAEWTEEQRRELEPFVRDKRSYNVVGTLSRHWAAKQNLWGSHVMGPTQTLPPRERELLILRTAWLCQAEYEWGRHVLFGRKAGLSDAEIERVKLGPDDPQWPPGDALLLRTADELHGDHCVSDATWAALSQRYEMKQAMDVVFTASQYTAIAMILNSFGVQLEPGVSGFQ